MDKKKVCLKDKCQSSIGVGLKECGDCSIRLRNLLGKSGLPIVDGTTDMRCVSVKDSENWGSGYSGN